jgi:transposase-like protein
MPNRGPGRAHRRGITLVELFERWPNDAAAEEWFMKNRWPNGVACPRCGSTNIETGTAHKTMPFRCRDCRKWFSVRTGTSLQSSKLGYQIWLIAMYLQATSLKGVSSMKLHRDLGITQKSAWFLAHRIREMWRRDHAKDDVFIGPIEADEAFIGGKVKSMSAKRRKKFKGRGPFANKIAVAGVKDRHTRQVRIRVIGTVTGEALREFVERHRNERTKLYTDEAGAYEDLKNHEAVKHSVREYVRDQIHTNGVESFWSMVKRSYIGTYHRMSFEHLPRYVTEFEARHNCRPYDTEEQLALMVMGAEGRILPYAELVEYGERAAKIALGWKPPVHWRHRRRHRKAADTNDTPAT